MDAINLLSAAQEAGPPLQISPAIIGDDSVESRAAGGGEPLGQNVCRHATERDLGDRHHGCAYGGGWLYLVRAKDLSM